MVTQQLMHDAVTPVDRVPVPVAGIGALPVGGPLAQVLAELDPGELDDSELLDAAAACERELAWLAGRQLMLIASLSRRRSDAESEFVADEILPALTLTRMASQLRVETAQAVTERFPAVLRMMLAGRVSLAKAQILVEGTADVADAIARAVVNRLLPEVPGWTTGQLRHRLAKAILQADPDAAARRAERAKKRRDVFLRRGEDGNAIFQSVLEAYDAAAIYEVINQAARAARGPDDERSLGEVRADVFRDVVLGRAHPGHAHPVPAQRNSTRDSAGASGTAARRGANTAAGDSASTVRGRSDGTAAETAAATGADTAADSTEVTGGPADAWRASVGDAGSKAAAPAAGAPGAAGNGSSFYPARGCSVGTTVNVVVSLSTLAALLLMPKPDLPGLDGLDLGLPDLPTGADLPGWIEGLGPVAGASVRELVWDLLHGARGTSSRIGWRIVACDNDTGAPHALGHTRYRPPQALQELVRARDRRCRFPGCRRAAAKCDIDHAVPFGSPHNGETCDCNLHSLCRHHHRLKQQPGWSVTLRDGISTWTAPTGHVYVDVPESDWLDGDDWSVHNGWVINNGWVIRDGWTMQDGELVRDGSDPRHGSNSGRDQGRHEDLDEARDLWEFPDADGFDDVFSPERIAWLGRTDPQPNQPEDPAPDECGPPPF